jgi:hypothetical protein
MEAEGTVDQSAKGAIVEERQQRYQVQWKSSGKVKAWADEDSPKEAIKEATKRLGEYVSELEWPAGATYEIFIFIYYDMEV